MEHSRGGISRAPNEMSSDITSIKQKSKVARRKYSRRDLGCQASADPVVVISSIRPSWCQTRHSHIYFESFDIFRRKICWFLLKRNNCFSDYTSYSQSVLINLEKYSWYMRLVGIILIFWRFTHWLLFSKV